MTSLPSPPDALSPEMDGENAPLYLWTDQPGADASLVFGAWFDSQAKDALASLISSARAAQMQLSLIARTEAEDTRRLLAKRRHDVKGALRTLGFVVQALEKGYQFEDGAAKAKIEAIGKAVQILTKEQDLLLRTLGG